jgi:hypothetical protein
MLQESASGLNAKSRRHWSRRTGNSFRACAGCAAYADQSAGAMSALSDSVRDSLAALDLLDGAFNARLESTGQNVPV